MQIFHESFDLKANKHPPPAEITSKASLVLVFGPKECFVPELAVELSKRYPNAQIAGCSSSGEIIGGELKHQNLQISAIKFDRKSRARVIRSSTEEVNIERIAHHLHSDDLKCVILLTEGTNFNGSVVIRNMRQILPNIPIVGGMASDDGTFTETFQLANDKVIQNYVVAIGLYGDNLHVNYASADGFSMYGPPKTITKVDKNIVYEINNQPALPLYKMYIGKYAAENIPPENLRYPVTILQQQSKNIIAIHKQKIRTVLGITDDSIIFGGEIELGAKIRFCHSNEDKLLEAIKVKSSAITSKISNLNIVHNSFLFCVSCLGRKIVLANVVDREAHTLRSVFSARINIAGFYANGEFCPSVDGKNTLHNQTMTMLHLCETS